MAFLSKYTLRINDEALSHTYMLQNERKILLSLILMTCCDLLRFIFTVAIYEQVEDADNVPLYYKILIFCILGLEIFLIILLKIFPK